MIVCDTNLFVEIYRGNSVIVDIFERIGRKNIVISDITRAELFYGAINKHELHYISKDIEESPVFPVTPQMSTLAVELVKSYCLSHKLHITDALIAATAIHHNLELYTLNVKDFIFIPGIKFYHP
jgi:predicted nucleic acid-binding protein